MKSRRSAHKGAFVPFLVIALAAFSIQACEKSGGTSIPQSAASADKTPAKSATVHKLHKHAPPASPTRTGKLRHTKTDQFTLTVSDIELSAGETATATLEVQPTAAWKFNPQYPVRVDLSGTTVSTPPAATLASHKDNGPVKAFAMTTGGMRLDMPFAAEVQGEDKVVAKVKFGMCSATTCQAVTQEVDWRVAVR